MNVIKIDASGWQEPMDFYDALLPLLGAPDWHGTSLDALTESMVWGGINSVEPPYAVQIFSTKGLPPAVLRVLKDTKEGLVDAREDFRERTGRDVEVYFEIVS